MSSFYSTAFQASLSLQAILFGVFGFLYSVYGMYSSIVTTNIQRAPIVGRLKQVCRVIALLIALNGALSISSLSFMYFAGVISGFESLLLVIGFALTILTIAIFSLMWVFRYME